MASVNKAELISQARNDSEIMALVSASDSASAVKLINNRYGASMLQAADTYHHLVSSSPESSDLTVIFDESKPQEAVLKKLSPLIREGDSFTFSSFKNNKDSVIVSSGLEGIVQLEYHRILQHFSFDIKLSGQLSEQNTKSFLNLVSQTPEPVDWRSENELPEDVNIFSDSSLLCRWQWDMGLVEVKTAALVLLGD